MFYVLSLCSRGQAWMLRLTVCVFYRLWYHHYRPFLPIGGEPVHMYSCLVSKTITRILSVLHKNYLTI